MKSSTVYLLTYAVVATAILAGAATALGAWCWLLVTLWALWLIGHATLIWYCWKITHPSLLDDLEGCIAREKAALLEYLRKDRSEFQAEQRCHRVGEEPIILTRSGVKGTQTGREAGGSE